MFKSTLHRVRLPTPIPADGIPDRFSMVWSNKPAPEAIFKVRPAEPFPSQRR